MLSLASFTAWKRRLVEIDGFLLRLDEEVVGEAVAALRARVDQVGHLHDAVGLAARLSASGRGPGQRRQQQRRGAGRTRACSERTRRYSAFKLLSFRVLKTRDIGSWDIHFERRCPNPEELRFVADAATEI